jgi:hypothetical protein
MHLIVPFSADDISLDFNVGTLLISTEDDGTHQVPRRSLIETASSKTFAEQLTYVDAVRIR